MALQNSTWQSLAKHKRALENDWYTGTIIDLGKRHGVPTPYNQAILFHLHRMTQQQSGPESLPVEAVIEKAKELSN
jgi:2-dehydropantoate 2-reductase